MIKASKKTVATMHKLEMMFSGLFQSREAGWVKFGRRLVGVALGDCPGSNSISSFYANIRGPVPWERQNIAPISMHAQLISDNSASESGSR